jgi:hypothetical protein
VGESEKSWQKYEDILYLQGGGEASPSRPSGKGNDKAKTLEWL